MKRSMRLEKFAELNAGLENNAGAALATAQALFEAQYSQLEKLEAYRVEYQAQLSEKLSNSDSASVIYDYHCFIASLNSAISKQTELVKQYAKKVEASRAQWIQRKQDVTKMNRAVDNIKRREVAIERRQEQIESDELSSNKMLRSQKADGFDI